MVSPLGGTIHSAARGYPGGRGANHRNWIPLGGSRQRMVEKLSIFIQIRRNPHFPGGFVREILHRILSP